MTELELMKKAVHRLNRIYPDLHVSYQFGEYHLVSARGEMMVEVIIVGANVITEDLYASFLSVKVVRNDAIVSAVYASGSTEFMFSMGEVQYGYTKKTHEKKMIEITQGQLSRFLGGDVSGFMRDHFEMDYMMWKTVEELVMRK